MSLPAWDNLCVDLYYIVIWFDNNDNINYVMFHMLHRFFFWNFRKPAVTWTLCDGMLLS